MTTLEKPEFPYLFQETSQGPEFCIVADSFGLLYVIPADKRGEFLVWDCGDDLQAPSWARLVTSRSAVLFREYRIE